MLDRIRRRLTVGYVGILALILVAFGVIVAVGFYWRLSDQQDQLLRSRAESKEADLASRWSYHGGDSYCSPTSPDSDVAYAVTSPDVSATYDDDPESAPVEAHDRCLGLPNDYAAQGAAALGKVTVKNVLGEEGAVRVVSLPRQTRDGEVVVVQAAQSRRRAVWDPINALVLVLGLVGVGALGLAAVGGLFMSRRAMRPARDAFERQRSFIADASHELKTPLTLIRADAEVLQRGLERPDDRELADDLLAETDRMNALLSDLLTLARLDAGKLAVKKEPFDLAAVVASTAERFSARARSEGKRLEVRFGPEGDGGKLLAVGDAERTGQVLASLLDNALRFTPEGGWISIEPRPADGRHVEAVVTDTGPGIPPEHLPRVFDRFYRADEARTRKGGGTGLGLAIARDLARHMGGDLTAGNAKKGQATGAELVLALPAAS